MTSQHGQHGKPAAQILPCPSDCMLYISTCHRFLDAPGEVSGMVGGGCSVYNKANMTSQHGQHGKPAAQILPCPSDCNVVHFNMS